MDINRGMGDLFNEVVVIFILNFDFLKLNVNACPYDNSLTMPACLHSKP